MMPSQIGRDHSHPAIACDDCTAVGNPDTLTLSHDDGCPVGRGLDEMSANDRAFFETRPNAPHRVRPVCWAEAQHLKRSGAVPADVDLTGWRVRIRPIGPGIRSRQYLPPRGGA
ncbi:hypothetical protein [Actinomadura violacea]|uniref:Uncharacterized protein n=1 Tax=Actinomadura violacea TaxID=2819934 RepID=A0ABS3RIJ6_9ACTN|nr:hypothetical protein [Actinomadura violacea]MBO2456551.1 hypothetical protein [Actinomadura violacea]